MITLLSAIVHFALLASNPSWSCAPTHRDSGVAGTYYLYCSQVSPDGVELVDVGRFVPDAKGKQAQPMILRAVINRLRKRSGAGCDEPSCPGWRVVDNADGRKARAIACAEGTAFHRVGLRGTDADIRQLPKVRDAIALLRTRTIAAERRVGFDDDAHIRVDPASMDVLGRAGDRAHRRAGDACHGWTLPAR